MKEDHSALASLSLSRDAASPFSSSSSSLAASGSGSSAPSDACDAPVSASSVLTVQSSSSSCRLQLGGLSCAACVQTVERALQSLAGVQRARVNLLLETADVAYDAQLCSPAAIVRCVEDVGFEAELKGDVLQPLQQRQQATRGGEEAAEQRQQREERVTLAVAGMSCASCVQTVESAVSALPFVSSCSVNLLTSQAAVVLLLASSSLSLADAASRVVAAIESVGFSAAVRAEDRSAAESLSRRGSIRFYRRHLLFALVFAVPVLLLAMVLPSVSPAAAALSTTVRGSLSVSGLLLWLLSTPVVVVTGPVFFRQALTAARHFSTSMSTLVSISVIASYLYATIGAVQALASDSAAPLPESGAAAVLLSANAGAASAVMFFETSSTLLTFILLGRYLEAVAKAKTGEALAALMRLQCSSAILCSEGDAGQLSGEEREVDATLLRRGDVVKVLRGATLPADGVVLSGSGAVNESFMTGEATPVSKSAGDAVVGSSLLEDGRLYVRVTAVGAESRLQQIVRLMEEAQASKAPLQQTADRISARFVPAVCALAAVVFFLWLTLALTSSLPESWYSDDGAFLFSFLFSVSVLVIACPCALGLATPTAVMVGTGVGARLGILIKGGEALETAHSVTAAVFDKTGTLTVGRPVLRHLTLLPAATVSLQRLYWLLGCSELDSEHVLAKACVQFARAVCAVPLMSPSSFSAVSGRGLSSVVDGSAVLIGNRQWMLDSGLQLDAVAEGVMQAFEREAETALCVAVDGRLTAVLGLADELKPESAAVLRHLQASGIRTIMCTGDHQHTADVVAARLGLRREDVVAQATPAGKLELVRRLQADGLQVAMVGDGVNDCVAMGGADLGVSIASGAEVAMEAADVLLMRDDLRDVITALHLSAATCRRIRLNFYFALLYNLLAIPVAAGVFFPLQQMRLPPELAALAMACSSVSVVLSSLALRRYSRPAIRSTQTAQTAASEAGELQEVQETLLLSAEPAEGEAGSGGFHDGCCACASCMCAPSSPSPSVDRLVSSQQRQHGAVIAVIVRSPPAPVAADAEKAAVVDALSAAASAKAMMAAGGAASRRTGRGARGACCSSAAADARCSCACGDCKCRTAPVA